MHDLITDSVVGVVHQLPSFQWQILPWYGWLILLRPCKLPAVTAIIDFDWNFSKVSITEQTKITKCSSKKPLFDWFVAVKKRPTCFGRGGLLQDESQTRRNLHQAALSTQVNSHMISTGGVDQPGRSKPAYQFFAAEIIRRSSKGRQTICIENTDNMKKHPKITGSFSSLRRNSTKIYQVMFLRCCKKKTF